MFKSAALLALGCVVGGANALEQPSFTRKSCRTTCQRFGMAALGSDFEKLQHPSQCMKHCNEKCPETGDCKGVGATSLLQMPPKTKSASSDDKKVSLHNSGRTTLRGSNGKKTDINGKKKDFSSKK